MGFNWATLASGGIYQPKSKSSGGSSNQMSETYDPLQAQKNAVASPLSKFLAAKVGTGIGQYPTDPNYINRYNEFMKVDPVEYFGKNVAEPTYQMFNKYARPLIAEGYAGNLRGSGRYGAEEAGFVGVSEALTGAAAEFVPSFAKSQIETGQSEFSRQYQNWYNSLPETNPVLSSAINFLNSGKQNTRYFGSAVGADQGATASDWGAELLKIGLQILPYIL